MDRLLSISDECLCSDLTFVLIFYFLRSANIQIKGHYEKNIKIILGIVYLIFELIKFKI